MNTCSGSCSKCYAEITERMGLKVASVYPAPSTTCECPVCKAKRQRRSITTDQEANLGGSIGDTSESEIQTETQTTPTTRELPEPHSIISAGGRVFLPRGKQSIRVKS